MRNKYMNVKVSFNGINFDSIKEAKRYQELLLLEKSGVVKDLELQVPFTLVPGYVKNGKKIREMKYIADFVYFDKEKNKKVVEDVKGVKTDVYKLKKKIFEYKYPDLEIFES